MAEKVMTAEEAAQHIGEVVTFEDEVMGMASSPQFKATYASFGGAYPLQKLSVLFAGPHEALLRELPRLRGRTVRITGKVTQGKSCPVIRIEDRSQIQVLEITERVELDATGEGRDFFRKMRATLQDRFKAGDYTALDAIARKWREGRERFLDGTWKISFFYDTLLASDLPFEENTAKLQAWHTACPDSITPHLAQADAWVQYAWKARGGDWAYKVTDADWKLFGERLAQARTELEARQERQGECPRWAAIMQLVALGQAWPREQYEALFEDAIRREPEYWDYYVHKANYLQPKWHGREGEWVEFANSLLERFPDGLGQELYARLAWSRRKETDQQLKEKKARFFPYMGFQWAPMQAGFERMRTRYPQSKWVINAYAIFAGKASDWETTNRLLLELGNDCDMDIWVTWQNVGLARMWAGGKGLSGACFILFR